MPFVGVMTSVLDTADQTLLGAPVHVNGQHVTSWSTVLRSLQALLLGFLFRRHRPNAFFSDKGELIAKPQVVA
jgi:hypothetical protein